MKIALTLFAVLFASTASACDALVGCYAAPLVQRQVIVQPYVQRQVVEYQVVPQVQKVIQYQAAPIVQKQIIQRQKVVVQRQRAYPLRASLNVLSRQRVIQRQRIVERSVY